jgi:hypothetical protein
MVAADQVATQRRTALTENTGLFERHRLAGIAQPLGMIDADAGDQRHVGVDQVHRIQTPAQTDFQHHGVQPCLLEQPERRQRAHFEVGQRDFATSLLDDREGLAQLLVSWPRRPCSCTRSL